MTITFTKPEYLALLLIVPFVILFAIRTRTRRRSRLHRFASSATSGLLKVEVHHLMRGTKWTMVCLVFTILVLSLAGPCYNERFEKIKLRNVDVLFLLDISKSMSAADVPPAATRLHLAKRKIRSLKKRLLSDRTGLIVFSKRAYTLCPLTIDENAFDFFLDDVDSNTISSGGTDISAAIRKAVDSFRYEAKTEKVILLVSDGEEPGRKSNAVKEAKRAAETGIKTFVLGIGSTDGSPIDEIDPDTGKPAISVPDFEKLGSIAKEGQGGFVEWSNSDYDVRKLAERISSMVEPDVFEVATKSKAIEFSMLTVLPYQVLLFIAIILLCIETFIKI